MLIAALPDTYLVLEVEHLGTVYQVVPHQSRAWVPAELGRALERAKLARVIDADAQSPWVGDDRWPQVTPRWETRH
jgi:hypothetical protein